MNKIKMLFWLLLSCLSLNAANITVTNQLTYHDHIDATSWFTDAKTTLFVPEFNPAIGTPVKAEVYMQLNITNRLYFENLQSFGQRSNEFTGEIAVTNKASISFWGVEVLNLFATNVFDATGFDGLIDYAGASGATYSNVVTQLVTFTVDPADISGYSVWQIDSDTSARAMFFMQTGHARLGTFTTAGVDVWVVYTYTNTFNCPDCVPCKSKCDNDREECDDEDEGDRKDKKDKDRKGDKYSPPKNKDCDDDEDRDKKNKNGRR